MAILESISHYAVEAAKTSGVVAGLIGAAYGLITGLQVPIICFALAPVWSAICMGALVGACGYIAGGLVGAAYGAVAPIVKSLFASRPKAAPASETSPEKGVTVIQSQSLAPSPAQSQSQVPANSNFREKVTQSRNAQTQCVQGG